MSVTQKNSSYVCENNHRHHLSASQPQSFTSDDIDDNLNDYKYYNYSSAQQKPPQIPPPNPFSPAQRINGYRVKMRGLPYNTNESNIYSFFSPIRPVKINFLFERDGRPSGECECDFGSHNEACEAMKYDKKFIGNRYIELFLVSGSMASNGGSISAEPHQKPQRKPVHREALSFSSFMNKEFGHAGKPRPSTPPLPVRSASSATPPMPVPAPAPLNTSAYSTSIGEYLMADMAHKMFTAAYNQFQQQQMQHMMSHGQHRQPPLPPLPPPPPPPPPAGPPPPPSSYSSAARRY